MFMVILHKELQYAHIKIKTENQFINIFNLSCLRFMDTIVNKLILSKSKNTLLLENSDFIINYSTQLGRPLFVCYDLFTNDKNNNKLKYGRKKFERDARLDQKNIYQLDPKSLIFSQTWSRGHLCPSFPMSYDKSKNSSWSATYLMSNIFPQFHTLNSFVWSKNEISIYQKAKQIHQPIKVIVGGLSWNYVKTIEFVSRTQLEKINPYENNNLVWVDKYNDFKYSIPNMIYQIAISEFNTQCVIALNNANSKIISIELEKLIKIITEH